MRGGRGVNTVKSISNAQDNSRKDDAFGDASSIGVYGKNCGCASTYVCTQGLALGTIGVWTHREQLGRFCHREEVMLNI